MSEWLRGRLAGKYIFFEMLPSFFMGIFIFVFILLMFQALRLTEFVLIHGVKFQTGLEIMLYLAISFLPVILPMSLLFSILLTYGRLSSDSEVVAFKALGLDMRHIAVPAFVLALITGLMSAQTSFYLAPWGNRQFELLINDLGKIKASATIKEGVFSQGFFDMVVYANKVDSQKGELEKVFIFDERNSDSPLTIIAKKGQIITEQDETGKTAFLRLSDGNVHNSNQESYTKVNFKTYDLVLFDPAQFGIKKKTLPSFKIDELNQRLKDPNLAGGERIKTEVEYNRRWALSVACIVFAMIGVGLGTNTNRRSGKSSGFVLSLSVIIGYWLMYVGAESLSKQGLMPTYILIWSVNVIFAVFGVWCLYQSRD